MDIPNLKEKIKIIRQNRPIQVNWAVSLLNLGILTGLTNFVYSLPPAFEFITALNKFHASALSIMLKLAVIKAVLSLLLILFVFLIFKGSKISRFILIFILIFSLIFDCFMMLLGSFNYIFFSFSTVYFVIILISFLSLPGIILLFTGRTRKWYNDLNLVKKGKKDYSDFLTNDQISKTHVWPILSIILINLSGITFIILLYLNHFDLELIPGNIREVLIYFFMLSIVLAVISFFRKRVSRKSFSILSLILALVYLSIITYSLGYKTNSVKLSSEAVEIKSSHVSISLSSLIRKCSYANDPDNTFSKIKNMIIISGSQPVDNGNFSLDMVLLYAGLDKIIYYSANSNGYIYSNGIFITCLNGKNAYIKIDNYEYGKDTYSYKQIKYMCNKTLHSYVDYWSQIKPEDPHCKLSDKLYKVGEHNCYKFIFEFDSKESSYSVQRYLYVDNIEFLIRLDESKEMNNGKLLSESKSYDYHYITFNKMKLYSKFHSYCKSYYKGKAEISDKYIINKYEFNSDEITDEAFAPESNTDILNKYYNNY